MCSWKDLSYTLILSRIAYLANKNSSPINSPEKPFLEAKTRFEFGSIATSCDDCCCNILITLVDSIRFHNPRPHLHLQLQHEISTAAAQQQQQHRIFAFYFRGALRAVSSPLPVKRKWG